jgi:hypothetical protein
MEAAIERPGWLSTDAWPWPVRAAATSTGRIAFTDFGRWSDFLHFQALWRALFPTAVQRMIPRVWGTTSRWATTLSRLLLGFATGTRRQ